MNDCAVRCWQITRSQTPLPRRSASATSHARWVGTARRADSPKPSAPPQYSQLHSRPSSKSRHAKARSTRPSPSKSPAATDRALRHANRSGRPKPRSRVTGTRNCVAPPATNTSGSAPRWTAIASGATAPTRSVSESSSVSARSGGAHPVGSRHVRPALRVDAAGAAPVDPRRAVGRGHDQLRVPVPVQVGRAELHAFDRGVDVLLGFDAQVGLMEQPHPTLGQQGQVRAAIAVEVAGGHRRTAVRRQHGLVAFAQAGGRSEVHVGVEAAGVAALLVADDQVGVAVAADVGHRRRGAAAGRQLGALAGAEDVPVHAGRRRLQVDLRVAEQQVHVAVAIQVQVVDALQHPGPRNVEVLAGVAEGAAPKRLESPSDPDAVFHHGHSEGNSILATHAPRLTGAAPGPAPSTDRRRQDPAGAAHRETVEPAEGPWRCRSRGGRGGPCHGHRWRRSAAHGPRTVSSATHRSERRPGRMPSTGGSTCR